MKKVFISQPMKDKTNNQILSEREKAIKAISVALDDEVEVIDSFFENAPYRVTPLWYLAKSLELLAGADVAYFCKGWNQYRGCKIEHTCDSEYGIKVFYEN